TTKAACLNTLWQAMLRAELVGGFRYRGIVLHDAEDVAHPDELALFAAYLPQRAMVQLPVVPLLDDSSHWISGHYADEFAEQHGKTMIVREAIGAAIPSAGVACCFEREALGAVAEDRGGLPFDPGALTEDYELGIRMSRGGRGTFVRLPAANGEAAVATREHFPATFDAALSQKTRWLVGIAFQGWDRLRWRGSLADKYMFLRDRKPVPNAIAIVLAYAALTLSVLCEFARLAFPALSGFAPVVQGGTPLAALLAVTSITLVWRLVLRSIFTWRIYGWRQGLLAVPRSLVANIFSVAAAWKATGAWIALLTKDTPLSWNKTAHRFPDDDQLCAR
ncbi:MAG: glycosyltransferase family 2 protein, partial [Pacificimonas sp.]|nr:glycosyltransferase family 2 protein [Pacificimonas sp.]